MKIPELQSRVIQMFYDFSISITLTETIRKYSGLHNGNTCHMSRIQVIQVDFFLTNLLRSQKG